MNEILKKILSLYNDFMIKLLRIRFFCIDKEKFIAREKKNNGGTIDPNYVNKSSKEIIVRITVVTVFITFLSTIPTTVWISIPLAVIDFIQFQVFLYIVQQKLLYLYGSKDLRRNKIIDYPNGAWLVWLQSNVMLGVKDNMRSKLKSAGGFIIRKAITVFFAKSPFRIVLITGIRQFLKWCGVVVTHQLVLSSLDWLIAIVCALVAAGVSLWQFWPMCKRFYTKLSANGLDYYEEAYFHSVD